MIEGLLFELRRTKGLGDRALDQLGEAGWHRRPDAEANSVAVLVQHLHGNMLSRWTAFLEEDGEKPWRERDAEFEPQPLDPAELRARREEGWRVCLGAIEALGEAELARGVRIGGEPLTALEAMARAATSACRCGTRAAPRRA